MKYDKESMRQLFEIDVKKRLTALENKANPQVVKNSKRLDVLEAVRKVQRSLNSIFAKKTAKVEKEIKKIWKWWKKT